MRKILVLLLLCVFMNGVSAQTAGTLSVSTNTSETSSPDYAPYHVIAIWIEDTNGKFVSSLFVSAKSKRIADLDAWNTASNGNVMNATTGATIKSHGTRTCTWSGKDANNVLVADGNYLLKMELTDNELLKNNLASFPFVKGANTQSQTAMSQNGFSAVSVVWTPVGGSSVSEIEQTNKYAIYPCPTKSNIFVNGYDIKSIDVLSLNGQLLVTSFEQNVNLSSLPKGVYLVSITTYSGSVIVKQIIKE